MGSELEEIKAMQECPPFDVFDPQRTCPVCNGQAAWTHIILRHRTEGEVGALMLRTCRACGFQYVENVAK